jgi:hypothetical protein
MEKDFFFFFLVHIIQNKQTKKLLKIKLQEGEVGLSVFPTNNLDRGRRRRRRIDKNAARV